jgi:hypothetical protein
MAMCVCHRKFAMNQLTKVCKVARSILLPYVADILGTMLEALSMLEPAEFNYFAQRMCTGCCCSMLQV